MHKGNAIAFVSLSLTQTWRSRLSLSDIATQAQSIAPIGCWAT
ncbi:hypothetical protein [Merismopedia glauca]|nr:hypothetical protein [Merismopedia glauca]